MKVFLHNFSLLQFGFVILCSKNFGKKGARKMLVKLSTFFISCGWKMSSKYLCCKKSVWRKFVQIKKCIFSSFLPLTTIKTRPRCAKETWDIFSGELGCQILLKDGFSALQINYLVYWFIKSHGFNCPFNSLKNLNYFNCGI